MKITQKNKDLFKLLKQGSAKVNPIENDVATTKATVNGSQSTVTTTYNGLLQPTKDLFTQVGITQSYMATTLPEAFKKLLEAITNINDHALFVVDEFSQRVAVCYSYHNTLKFLDDTYTEPHPPFEKTFEYISEVSLEDLVLITNLAVKLRDDWRDLPATPTLEDVTKVANTTKDFVAQCTEILNHVNTDVQDDINYVNNMIKANTNGWIAKILPTWNSDDSLTPTIDLIFTQDVKDILNRPE